MKTDKKRLLAHILSILLVISLIGLSLYYDAYNRQILWTKRNIT